MSYTNIFGGYNINTAFPSYAIYTIPDGETLQLTWPSSFVDNSNVAAQIIDLIGEGINSRVALPNATLISAGQEIQFSNRGQFEIDILDFDGSLIASIPPTDVNQQIIYLRDNTTSGGEWAVIHLGSGTSSADASVLAGYGLVALDSTLNTNFPGKTVVGNYQVQLSDRGSILVWTGGAGTITLPPQLAGFPIAVNNAGSGTVVIDTTDGATIDGENTFALNPSESSSFIGVEANWNTLGYGVESFFQVNVLSPLNLSAVGATLTLTNQQASRLVQQYTGLLTQDVIIYYPAASGQWYIWNNTTGPHTVTARLSGPIGNPIVIPQGEKVILYSDGTSIYNTPTIATSAVFPDGTEGGPGITFQSDSTTGFFKPPTPPAGVIGYSSAGTQSLTFGGVPSGIPLGINGGLPGVYWDITNSHYVGFKAPLGLITDIVWRLPGDAATSDGQILFSTASNQLLFTTATYPETTSINRILYSSANNVIDQIPTANNGVLVTSGSGVPSIGSTLPTAVQGNITSLGIVTSGTVRVAAGGTGINTTTAYGVICGGTTATGNFQNVGAGTSGRVLTSNGAGALPTWNSLPSSISAASQAQQQAASSTSVYVSPGRQQFHPSAASFWVDFNGADGSRFAYYNVSSVTRNSAGNYTITIPNNFSSSNYVVQITVRRASGIGNPVSTIVNAQDSASVTILTYRDSATPMDFEDVYVEGFGTLA
jgi:hypothetical protein